MSEQEKITVNDLPMEGILDEKQMRSVEGASALLNPTRTNTSSLGLEPFLKLDGLTDS